MSKRKIILLIIVPCIFILFIGINKVYEISYSSFADDMCGNKIIRTEFSPDKKYKIVIFLRDCGATTNFSTQVSILKVAEKLKNESGNIFSADSERGKAKIDENNIVAIKSKWISNNKVIITYDKNARIFKTQNSLDEIEIDYMN